MSDAAMRTVAITIVLLCSCGPRSAASFVPALTIYGQLAPHDGVTDYRVGASLTLRDRDRTRPMAPYMETPLVHQPSACRDAALCAWERRASFEALRRLGEGD
jgi:hypothetical protein